MPPVCTRMICGSDETTFNIFLCGKADNGKNNALNVYMNRADRVKSVLEYYLKEKLKYNYWGGIFGEGRKRKGSLFSDGDLEIRILIFLYFLKIYVILNISYGLM